MNKTFDANKNMLTGKTNIIFLIVFVLLTFVDRITKYAAVRYLSDHDVEIIPDVLDFHYLENRGAAWGIMQDRTWLLITITVVVLAVIVALYLRIPVGKRFHLFRFCLVLLAAGALGNLIDRCINHYVIDFIYFELIHFPVFNVADCYVCISAVLIFYCILFRYKEDELKLTKKGNQ